MYGGGWRGNGWKEVTITSVDEEGYAWIRKENKSREKVSSDTCRALTSENLKAVEEIKKINKEIEELQEKAEKYAKDMPLAVELKVKSND